MSTQYVKNTDVPNQDSFLWSLGDGWKVSQKTGDPWAYISTITDEVLGTALTEISETGKIDIIDYQSYFFVPNKFISKYKDKKTGEDVEKITWSVFAFENRIKADNKLAEIKKFANYQPKTQQTTTVPKLNVTEQQAMSKPTTQEHKDWLEKRYDSTSKPITASTAAQPSSQTQFSVSSNTENTMTTFTDPTPVVYDNKELIATMLSDGYSFLPRSLVGDKTFWMEDEYDQQSGDKIGTKLIFLMGRIINVKIVDNN